jgi:GGDEF domain-containing protein
VHDTVTGLGNRKALNARMNPLASDTKTTAQIKNNDFGYQAFFI